MLTLHRFESVYGGDKKRARHKYLTALFRFGTFGGVATFGTPKRPLEAADLLPEKKRISYRPPFDADQVDEYGFVESVKLRMCDLPPELSRYLPSTELVDTIKVSHKRMRDKIYDIVEAREEHVEEQLSNVEFADPIQFEQDGEIIQAVQMFRRLAAMNFSYFFALPESIRESLPRPDASFPVYLRDHCTSKSVRELQTCVPRIYYHFGACGIQVEDLLMYMNHVPGFQRLYPYRLMSSRAENLFEVSARNFFMDDRVDVALYGIKTQNDAFGYHGLHARFAVKDRVRRRIVLFDPLGSFRLVDKYEQDYVILNRVLKSITDGIRVKVVRRIIEKEAVDVVFYGYHELGGFFETIKNVSIRTLFMPTEPTQLVPAHMIAIDEWYLHKLPASSVHGFTGVERATVVQGYEGDQPAEASCALVALMRASFVAHQMHERPLDNPNPIDFVQRDIPCYFAVFMSMLAQSFSLKEDNFRLEMLDSRAGSGVFVSVQGLQDSVWVNKLPRNRTMTPALKIVRFALSRLAMTRDVSMNPYRYRLKIVHGLGAGEEEGVKYLPLDAKVDISCVDADDSCKVVIEPLPEDLYNVSVFVKREDKTHSSLSPQLQEMLMSMGFVRRSTVRDMNRFLTPPIDETTHALMMRVGQQQWVPNDSPIIHSFDPSAPGTRNDVWLIVKSRMVQVSYFDDNEMKLRTVRIDYTTQVRDVVREIVAGMRNRSDDVNYQMKYRNNPVKTFFPEDTCMFHLNTDDTFHILKLHKLQPDATVLVRYKDYADDVREIRIPIHTNSTIGDVKQQFQTLVHDDKVRHNLTRSFDSYDNVGSNTTKLYPNFDSMTLYYL